MCLTEEENFGAGNGASAFEFKSGIGNTSRILRIDDHQWTIVVLAHPSFAVREELMINVALIGRKLRRYEREETKSENGAAVIIIATDLPPYHRGLLSLSHLRGNLRTISSPRNKASAVNRRCGWILIWLYVSCPATFSGRISSSMYRPPVA